MVPLNDIQSPILTLLSRHRLDTLPACLKGDESLEVDAAA